MLLRRLGWCGDGTIGAFILVLLEGVGSVVEVAAAFV